jgi:hypothetical protein
MICWGVACQFVICHGVVCAELKTKYLGCIVRQRSSWYEWAFAPSYQEDVKMESELGKYAADVAKAREAYKKAIENYSAGAGTKQLNEAQAEYAAADQAYWQCAGGLAQTR